MKSDEVYTRAVAATGKSEAQLRAMAEQVFASMLHHAMEQPGVFIWSVIVVGGEAFNVEVNVPPRRRIGSSDG